MSRVVSESREARNDTVSQLKTFQAKLEEFKEKDGILLTEAQKAQNEIMAAVSKAYDKQELKGKLTSGMAESIRKEIKLLAVDTRPETVPKVMGLLQKLIDLGASLTQDEKEFYEQFQGTEFEKVSTKEKGRLAA